jgi:cytochrome c-type biogenesis protein CcmH
MTTFVLVCAAMIAAALLWLVLPLLRRRPAADEPAAPKREVRTSALALVLAVPTLAALMYAALSDWNFDEVERQAATSAETDRLLEQLELKLAENPQDMNGWMLLGRSYTALGRFPEAIQAYQHAYDISKGENVEATLGLAEALVLTDGASLSGRAGSLLNAALQKAPHHPKALWYGSMAALQAGDLRTGRDRLQLLLAQNPPEQLRAVLARQIEDLNQQIGEAGEGDTAASPADSGATGGRVVRVAVSIEPKIQAQLEREYPLFVLARDPAGGPPLAVQRRSTSATPLTLELSERDAMTPTRTIANAARVQIVARVSKSGTPQAQRGDYYGEAEYDFSRDQGVVNIVIDRTVP